MSAPLNPSLPLHKSAEITKHLRSRDVPLLSLLPLARSILELRKLNDKNIYFPHKEEWLLEWAVQRHREVDSTGASEARCNPDLWEFILQLLPSSASAGVILKKHNVLQLISKTFSEAVLLPNALALVGFNGNKGIGEDGIYNTRDIVFSPSSSPVGRRSPVAWTTPQKLQQLLTYISKVLLYLQENWMAGSREGNIVTVLRGTPEIGAQILGSYLGVCQVLVQNGLELEKSWIGAVVNVWRSCVWGNPNSKKLSMLFSTFCLVPAARLISIPTTSSYLRSRMEGLIAEFIFSHETIFTVSNSGTKSVKPSPTDLGLLLEPLKVQKKSLPHIFKIGIASQTRKRKPDSDIVEAIFSSIVTGALGIGSLASTITESDAEIVMGMLEVLVDTRTTISSETLAKIVDEISNLSSSDEVSVRWNIIKLALELDFDIFLGNGSESRTPKLIDMLTKSDQDQVITLKVIELLIDGFVKARDLGGFIKTWVLELSKEEAKGGVWEDDRVAKVFADRMEKGMLAGQIDKILKMAFQAESWVVVDAVLRGVRREDTEDKIRGTLIRVIERVSKGGAGWRGWRILVRASQVDKGLVKDMQRQGLKAMKNSASVSTQDQARETLFAGEILMSSASINLQAEVLSIAVGVMKNTREGWDGSISEIRETNLGVALVTGFTSRWLEPIELVSSDVRTGFVDGFLDMAMSNNIVDIGHNITWRSLWGRMLAKGVFYEYPAIKDAVLAALISKLGPFSDMLGCVKTSLENIRKGNISISQGEADRYEFILESIASYPPKAIRRATREKILDALVLLDSGLEVTQVHGRTRDLVKMLVERLWSLGNTSSFLARNSGGFMDWMSNGGVKVGRGILRYVFATKEQEQSRQFLTDLAGLAKVAFFQAGVEIEVVKACEVIVEEFWRAGEKASVEQLRAGILKKMRESIEVGEVNSQYVGIWRRMWILDPDSNDEKETMGLSLRIIAKIKPILPKILAVTGGDFENGGGIEEAVRVAAETVMLLCGCSRTEEEAVKTTALVIGMLDSQFTGPYKSDITAAYKDMVENRLRHDTYLKCLERVSNGCFGPGSEAVEAGYFEVLKILVYGAKKPEDDATSKSTIVCLSTVLSEMARNLPKTKTVNEFLAVSDCMNIILHEKTWAVLQYNIDETLTSVAITSSPSGPCFNLMTDIDEIFVQLCNLSRVVLTLHRRRVRGGRYHLFVAVIQSLLHCIYKRKAPGERRKSDKVVHPPWLLEPSRVAKLPAITGRRADNFNRLVTTFCEPSASSVRDRTRRRYDASPVYSARDREKREVASCVGGVLGEILKGELEGGFEEDITVSISAIFEVLGPEGVKAFARTVDKEGRAMLRELWDEYNRVGGGAGEKL